MYNMDEIKRIYAGVEAETMKSQASFQSIQVLPEALPRMRLRLSENEPEISVLKPQHNH